MKQTDRSRATKKLAITPKQILFLVLTLVLVLLINLLLFFGLLYKNGGSTTIPSDGRGDTVATGGAPNNNSGDLSSASGDPAGQNSGDVDPSGGEEGRDAEKYSYAAQNFESDLSAYEEYMNPAGDDYLLLVNVDSPLSADYDPDDLVDVKATRDDGRDAQKMRRTAEMALEALFMEAEKEGILYSNDGIVLSVTSAYRSYASQSSIFNSYVKETMDADPSLSREEAERKVMTYSCRPGTSEHQSGLCCDMHNFPAASVSNGMREKFAESKAGKWLVEKSAKFGFVLRFPADKTDVTGIEYESWHFRFVGRYHAMQMQERGLCLEEYLQAIS